MAWIIILLLILWTIAFIKKCGKNKAMSLGNFQLTPLFLALCIELSILLITDSSINVILTISLLTILILWIISIVKNKRRKSLNIAGYNMIPMYLGLMTLVLFLTTTTSSIYSYTKDSERQVERKAFEKIATTKQDTVSSKSITKKIKTNGVYKIGDIIRSDDGFELTINKVYYVDKSDDDFKDMDSIKGRILILETKIKNNTSIKFDEIFPEIAHANDDKDNKYNLMDYIGGFRSLNDCCMNFDSKVVKNINFAFDVPKDANITQVELSIKSKNPAVINIK